MADKKKGAAKAPAPAPAAAAAAPAPKAQAAAPTKAAASASTSTAAHSSSSAGKRKPDEAKYEKEMTAIDSKIAELQAKIESLKTRIDNADSSSPGSGKKKALIDERRKLNDEFRAHRDEKDRLFKQFEALRKVRDDKLKEAEEHREKAGPYKSADKIDQAIADMEAKIRAGNLRLIDEKKYVTEISNLKKGKKGLEVYEKKVGDLEGDKKAIDDIKAKLDAKSEELKKAAEALAKVDAQLDDQKKTQEEDKAKISSLVEERTQLRAQMEQMYEKKRETYSSFKVIRDEYRAFQQEEVVKRKEAQRLQREQMMEEKKKALEEKRKEERLLPKFVEEISSASTIISFLTNTYLTEKTHQEASQEKKAVDKVDGMVALKSKAERNSEDLYFVGKKEEKKKAPAPKVVKKTDNVKLSIAMLDQFTLLGVSIPATVGDVEATIKALHERKEHFEAKQKAALEKAQKEVEEELKNASLAEANGTSSSSSFESAPAAAVKKEHAEVKEEAKKEEEDTKPQDDDKEEGEAEANGDLEDGEIKEDA